MQPEFMAKYEAVLSRNYVSCLLEGSFQEVNTLQDQMRDNASTIDDAANAIIDCNKELKKKDEKVSAEVWCLLINRLQLEKTKEMEKQFSDGMKPVEDDYRNAFSFNNNNQRL